MKTRTPAVVSIALAALALCAHAEPSEKRKETLDALTQQAAQRFAMADFCSVGDQTIKDNLTEVIRLTGSEQEAQQYAEKFDTDQTIAGASIGLVTLFSKNQGQPCEGANLAKIQSEQQEVAGVLASTLSRIRNRATQASQPTPTGQETSARVATAPKESQSPVVQADYARSDQQTRSSTGAPAYLMADYRCFTRTMGFNGIMMTTPTSTTFTIRRDGTYIDPEKAVGHYRVDAGSKTIRFLDGNLKKAKGDYSQLDDGKGRIYLSFGENDNGWAGQNCAAQ